MSWHKPAAGGRYRARGSEAESEPGSGGRVLRNKLSIRSVRAMGQRESEALLAATQRLIDETDRDHRFTAEDIRHMHRLWLGEIYPWAGDYRRVNLAKGDFPFAAANRIPRLVRGFEQGPLREFTPCRFADAANQARALAVVHAELILSMSACDSNSLSGSRPGRESWASRAAMSTRMPKAAAIFATARPMSP